MTIFFEDVFFDFADVSPFELEFMPVSPRGFALFTQQDIDQEGYGKGLNFFTMMHFCY